ncbi:MAG: hypothetical protein HOM87_11585, partial [Proteobacteria bacterium]|nr:hypothetical protein [Pseudomonadota bacterium]
MLTLVGRQLHARPDNEARDDQDVRDIKPNSKEKTELVRACQIKAGTTETG